jgi:DNA-binding IclR family transcriptional regulator
MTDLFLLPEPLSGLLNWMVRKNQASLAEICARLGQDEGSAQSLLAEAQQRGYLSEVLVDGETQYRIRMAPRRGTSLPANLW